MQSRIRGRCTFTTTRSPAWVVARCTCAMEALASGWSSSAAKISDTGRPSPRSISWWISAAGRGGQSSCKVSSSSTQCAGRRSGRDERSWPSFVKVGPSSARSWRKRAAVERSGAGSGSPSAGAGASRPRTSRSRVRARYAPNPCRATAAAICRRRLRSWNARSNMDRSTVAPRSGGRRVLGAPTGWVGRGRTPPLMKQIAQAATPMMRQYLETKARYPDAILFFRLGDFYEMFFEDALTASEALQITLTARSKGDDKVPMCGVPHHAARGYVAKLLERGFKVAICDQVEEAPAPAPGGGDGKARSPIFRREVTRVVTPGMVLDDQVLDPREASYLGAVALGEGAAGLALLDASTGELRVGEVRDDGRLVDELRRAGVRELLLAAAADPARAAAVEKAVGVPAARRPDADFDRPEERLRRNLGVASLDGFGVGGLPLGLSAAAAALAYLSETQRAVPRHVDRLSRLATDDALLLDEATRTNLELERTLYGGNKKGTLLAIIDRTVTAPGARRIAEWLRYPLTDLAAIGDRLDSLAELEASAVLREDLAGALRPVADAERLLSRLVLGQGNARDLRALAGALLALPPLADLLAARTAPLLRDAAGRLRGLEPLAALLDRAVAEEPPPTLKEGGLVRRGYSAELDEIVAIAEDGKGVIARLETKERERTGIGSLKVRYNRVFGYYIEVTKANLHLVPKEYERRQTTVGGERFATAELKSFEEKVLTAEERRFAMEERLYEELRARVIEAAPLIRTAADAVATADVLLSLARVAAERGYVRPVVDASEVLEIEDGRHPVVEALLEGGPAAFVPNDLHVVSRGEPPADETGSLLVVTGPIMAGKSTVMRQAALVVLLAQMGSFVPARRARVGIVDRPSTRAGAPDDID